MDRRQMHPPRLYRLPYCRACTADEAGIADEDVCATNKPANSQTTRSHKRNQAARSTNGPDCKAARLPSSVHAGELPRGRLHRRIPAPDVHASQPGVLATGRPYLAVKRQRRRASLRSHGSQSPVKARPPPSSRLDSAMTLAGMARSCKSLIMINSVINKNDLGFCGERSAQHR